MAQSSVESIVRRLRVDDALRAAVAAELHGGGRLLAGGSALGGPGLDDPSSSSSSTLREVPFGGALRARFCGAFRSAGISLALPSQSMRPLSQSRSVDWAASQCTISRFSAAKPLSENSAATSWM